MKKIVIKEKRGLGFGVWGLGFGGLGFGVWGLGFGVWANNIVRLKLVEY